MKSANTFSYIACIIFCSMVLEYEMTSETIQSLKPHPPPTPVRAIKVPNSHCSSIPYCRFSL